LPIIALTANDSNEDEAMCLSAGMNAMLSKPVALPDLLGVIARYVWPHRSDRMPPGSAASVIVPASPVLSVSRIDELRTTLPSDTLAGLVEDCLVELAERLANLQSALRRQDTEAVLAEAHAMAGMAAEYGMQGLDSRLRVLMRAARDEPGEAIDLGDELQAAMVTAASALRETLHIEMV
jgi:CheY-like chemotaxis protein